MSAERRQQARKVRVKSSVLNLSALSSGLRLYYFRIGIESNWNQGSDSRTPPTAYRHSPWRPAMVDRIAALDRSQ